MIATRGNMGLSSCESLVTTFASVDQYIILFYVSFCLKTPYSIYIFDSLALNPWPTAQLLPEQNLANMSIFSIRHVMAFLHFGQQNRMFLSPLDLKL